jgi:mechanosensitive ion channel-like protein
MVDQFEAALRLAGTRIAEGVANFLPGALVFLVLLLGAFVVAVILRYVLQRGLSSLDFDRRAELLGVSLAAWTPSGSVTMLIASLAYWLVLAVGLLLGLTALDAALPSQFAVSVLQYVPHLVAALLILVVGGIFARFLARAVLIGAVNMRVQYARLLSLTVKWLVLIVAAAMALDHVGIGRTVLLLAFGIVFGGVVLAIALAVGLGARDAVGRALDRQLRESSGDDTLHHV